MIDDCNEIIHVTDKHPKKICIYTAPPWKYKILKRVIELQKDTKVNVGQLMKEFMADPAMKSLAQQVSHYVGKIAGEVKRYSDTDAKRFLTMLNEKDYLISAKTYLAEVFSCDIEIYQADEPTLYDPMQKHRFATPLRPALYIE